MDLSVASVKVTLYDRSSFKSLSRVKLRPIKNLTLRKIDAPEANLDLLWHATWFFAPTNNPRPNWSGNITGNNSIRISISTVPPIIDLNPSDETCIYSTVLFVIEEAKKLNIPSPCITFDQPLWQKAMGIMKDKNLQTVCRLGGFHMLMSFLGSMGNLMNGSSWEKAFEEVYSEDTIIFYQGHTVAKAHSKGTYTGPECFSQSQLQHINR